jgi:hypothetical protein
MRIVLKPNSAQSSFKNDATEDKKIQENTRVYLIAFKLI